MINWLLLEGRSTAATDRQKLLCGRHGLAGVAQASKPLTQRFSDRASQRFASLRRNFSRKLVRFRIFYVEHTIHVSTKVDTILPILGPLSSTAKINDLAAGI